MERSCQEILFSTVAAKAVTGCPRTIFLQILYLSEILHP